MSKPGVINARLIVVVILSAFVLAGLLIEDIPVSGSADLTSTAAAAPPTPQGDPVAASGGKWSGLVKTKDVPVHISMLPDGKLLYWGRDKASDGYDVQKRSKVYLWDPLYIKDDEVVLTQQRDNATTNLFCSGHSFLPDGKLLVSGGHAKVTSTPMPGVTPTPNPSPTPINYSRFEGVGETHLNIYDYKTGTWTGPSTLPQMSNGRWYPYNVTLANGETLIMSGTFWTGGFGFRTGIPTISANRTMTIFDLAGGIRTLAAPGTNNVSPAGTLITLPLYYPYISLLTNGNAYIAGPGPNTVIDASGSGFYTRPFKDPFDPHNEGTSVMYAPGKIIILGGSGTGIGGAMTTAAHYNEAPGVSDWQSAGTLTHGRHYPTATVLPDGNVLVTGGTNCAGTNNLDCGPGGTYGGAVQTPELWDPAEPQVWRQMTPTTSGVPRVYHSIALLMLDGRVLVGGGGLPAAKGETVTLPGGGSVVCQGTGPDDFPACREFGHKNVEFYSPPYLFNANGSAAVRPAIISAPPSISYGQTFKVGIGNVKASQLKEKAVLIRLPSVTHTYNQDQRRIEVNITRDPADEDNITITAPGGGTVCPPGPYMLFLINNNGRNTPSVAKVIRVGNLSLDRESRAFYPEAFATGDLNGTIQIKATSNLAWTVAPDAAASGWVTITSGSSGAGDGLITFTVAPNVATASRSGKLRISVVGQSHNGHEFAVQQAGKFSDIVYPPNTPESMFYKEVSKIFAKGVTTGCGPNIYCPNSSVTRMEMAVFMVRAMSGSEIPPSPPTQTFSDVPASHWAYHFIESLFRRGITSGCDVGKFCPDGTVTRAEMATFIIKAIGARDYPGPATPSFLDVPTHHWAYNAIEEVKRRQIASGYGNGNFGPEDPVTREQMAKFLTNAFGY